VISYRHAVVDDDTKNGITVLGVVDLLDVHTRWWHEHFVSLEYNLAGLRCVQAQVIPVSPRLDMSQFFGSIDV